MSLSSMLDSVFQKIGIDIKALRNETTVTSVSIEVVSGAVQTTVATKTLGSATSSSVSTPMPVASSTTPGVMPSESFGQIETNTTDITMLKGASVGLIHDVDTELEETTSQSDLTAAWIAAGGSDPPVNGNTIISFAPATLNNTWTWFAGSDSWRYRGNTLLPIASNTSLGVVIGDAATSGKVAMANNGSMAVNGWSDTQTAIANAQAAITNNQTAITGVQTTVTSLSNALTVSSESVLGNISTSDAVASSISFSALADKLKTWLQAKLTNPPVNPIESASWTEATRTLAFTHSSGSEDSVIITGGGEEPVGPGVVGSVVVEEFIVSSDTVFTLAHTGAEIISVIVNQTDTLLIPEYSLSGMALTIAAELASGDTVQVTYFYNTPNTVVSDLPSTQAGHVKVNFNNSDLGIAGFTAGTEIILSIRNGTVDVAAYPTTVWPRQQITDGTNNYASGFLIQGSDVTGDRLRENNVMGQVHRWRIIGSYGGKAIGTMGILRCFLKNPDSNLFLNATLTVPSGITGESFTYDFTTIANANSLSPGQGYQIGFSTSFDDSTMSVTVASITRISEAIDVENW